MQSIEFFPIPVLIGLAVWVVFLPFLWRKKHSLAYLVLFTLFWVYLLVAIGLTLFPIRIPGAGTPGSPMTDILSRINLIPFHFGHAVRLRFLLRSDLVGNGLLTIPFGFLLPLIMRVRKGAFPWLMIGIGLVFELSQLAVSLLIGLAYRVVDINDVLMNTTGAFIGYGLYAGIAWLGKRISNQVR